MNTVLSPEAQLGHVLRRIATATNVIRTRTETEVRAANHGEEPMSDRVRALVIRLELVAEQLEEAVATR